MDALKLYSHLDRELEKQVFIFSVEEGLFGLWELVQNVNHYEFLSLVDKYAIAYDLLKELLTQELVKLEEFEDASLTSKVRDIDFAEAIPVLDNPRSWDLNGTPFYSLYVTVEGKGYLDKLNQDELRKLDNRLSRTK